MAGSREILGSTAIWALGASFFEVYSTDPFASLAPAFGRALPSPAPTPTGPPPVAAVAPPSSAFGTAFQEESAMPSPGLGTQSQAASATLFGLETSLTAYDLSAPAAPKPKVSGNPFA